MNRSRSKVRTRKGLIFSKAKFRSHLADNHTGMDMEKYSAQHGDPMQEMKLLNCAKCGEIMTNDSENILAHLTSAHDMSPNDYHANYILAKKESEGDDDESKPEGLTFVWDQCMMTCGVCEETWATDDLLANHVRKAHKFTMEYYRENYNTLKVWFFFHSEKN